MGSYSPMLFVTTLGIDLTYSPTLSATTLGIDLTPRNFTIVHIQEYLLTVPLNMGYHRVCLTVTVKTFSPNVQSPEIPEGVPETPL